MQQHSSSTAYGVYISQLIRYSRACDSYQDVLDRGFPLTRKHLNQGFLWVKLKSSLRKFYGRHHDLVDRSFVTYHRVCNQINMTGATSESGTAQPSGAPELTLGFQWGSYYSIFSFMCMLYRSLFVVLYFFFWSLCCLFFSDYGFSLPLWYLQTLLHLCLR